MLRSCSSATTPSSRPATRWRGSPPIDPIASAEPQTPPSGARPAVPWGVSNIRRSLTMTKTNMRCLAAALALAASIGWMAAPTMAADDSKVKSATRQVETGAKEIGEGKLGADVAERGKGGGAAGGGGARGSG